MFDRGDVDLCMTSPGYDVDLTVDADLRAMVEVWMGERPFQEALRQGTIEVEGPRALARDFPRWLKRSVFADVPRG